MEAKFATFHRFEERLCSPGDTTRHVYGNRRPDMAKAAHGSPGGLKVRRGRQKDAIEELNRLHMACRIESYDEAQPGPLTAIAHGT